MLPRPPLLANAGYLTGIQLVSSVAGIALCGLAVYLRRTEGLGLAAATVASAVLAAVCAALGTRQSWR